MGVEWDGSLAELNPLIVQIGYNVGWKPTDDRILDFRRLAFNDSEKVVMSVEDLFNYGDVTYLL